jgi:8-oxo-dGTP pyrophosphatase MutT (NUDIX family)
MSVACVALILRKRHEALFIRRAMRQGDKWSGHIALPGGRQEVFDASNYATCLREVKEEIGIDLTVSSTFEFQQEISNQIIPIKTIEYGKQGLTVHVFVFRAKSDDFQIKPDPKEVAETAWVDLEFDHPQVWIPTKILPLYLGVSKIWIPLIQRIKFDNVDFRALRLTRMDEEMSSTNREPFILWGMTLRIIERYKKLTNLPVSEDQRFYRFPSEILNFIYGKFHNSEDHPSLTMNKIFTRSAGFAAGGLMIGFLYSKS